LFGTVKGAFTGAMDKNGLFERANGGTLFLDEVNSMPIGLQVKLLRALQEKKIRRVGSLTEISIDLKIISSVNQEPHQAIRIGTLRSDLFYRIGVVFISVPPLRERPDDIEALTNHFLEKFNRLIGKSVLRVSPQVNDMFHRYRWPGNVRELEHLIEGAMNLVLAGNEIRPEHLPMHFIKACTLQPTHQPVENIFMDQSLGLTYDPISTSMDVDPSAQEILDQLPQSQFALERESIMRAMRHAKGNVAQAARSIGISRQLLNYKLKKHELRRDRFLR
jgi:arginine utilization regulatory protein